MLVAIIIEIGIVNRKAHAPSRKETFFWSIVWISLALSFNIFIYFALSSIFDSNIAAFKAKEFFTGYLIELSLSIDNLFVFSAHIQLFQSSA